MTQSAKTPSPRRVRADRCGLSLPPRIIKLLDAGASISRTLVTDIDDVRTLRLIKARRRISAMLRTEESRQ